MSTTSVRKIRDALQSNLRIDSHLITVDGANGQMVNMLLKPIFQPYDGRGVVKLTEDNTRNGIKEIYISDIDACAIVLKPDHFGITCFQSGGYNKGCDYVLLTKYNNLPYAFFIDLKADVPVVASADNKVDCSVPLGREIAWQMIGASALLDALLAHLRKIDAVSEIKFEKRFILLCSYPVTKKRSFDASINPPPLTAAMTVFPKAYFDKNKFVYFTRKDGETISVGMFV